MTHRWARGGALRKWDNRFYGPQLLQPATVLDYLIASSLRFNSADSAYLNRTFTTPTSNTTWTLSMWVKLSSFASHSLFSSDDSEILINSSAGITFWKNNASVAASTAVFRDPAAWYHFVFVSNGTTVVAYSNNSQVLSYTGTIPDFNSAIAHRIGQYAAGGDLFNGYLAEVHFVDGTALTPGTFGQTDSTTGQWVPKRVTGVTYGTNGFYLPFSDNSGTTSTTLGKDGAGSNNWTPNNFSVTAGVGNDSLTDTPTNNFCVLSPINTGSLTVLNGGLQVNTVGSTGANKISNSTMLLESGKWACEVTVGGANVLIGIAGQNAGSYSSAAYARTYFGSDGQIYTQALSGAAFGATFTTNDVIRMELDMGAGTCAFYKNNSLQGTVTGISAPVAFVLGDNNSSTVTGTYFNFGQRAWVNTPNTGFNAVCTSNLPTPSIVKPNTYFDVETFTGTGATRSKTGLGFQPDLVWFKGRSGATDHAIYDAVRGVQKQLESNQTGAETTETTGLTAFNSDGYTIGTLAQLNTNAATYVSWLWKEGVTPGFDIVSYTGNGANRTISHALGVAPKMMIVRALNSGGAVNWFVYHATTGAGNVLSLDATSASTSASTAWNSTAPTSSVFSVGTHNFVNQNAVNFIAYLFAEVAGFSRFGSYTGNGSADGPFVHCGFRPRWIMIKSASGAEQWSIYDTARDTLNVATLYLAAQSSGAEGSATALDILSNGFKIRQSTSPWNTSGSTYVFAAFAEAPFKYATAR